MTTLYRLHTERFDNLALLTSARFDAFTVVDATGYWRGIAENAAVIEIYGTPADEPAVRELAERIREQNNQEAVGFARFDLAGTFELVTT